MPNVKFANIKIIHAEKDFAVIEKPAGLPSTDELFSGGKLVHRIDTATQGLLLFALNDEAYTFFLSEQEAGRFTKQYSAHCDTAPNNAEKLGGFPPHSFALSSDSLLTVQSAFRAWGAGRKEVRPVNEHSGKFAKKKGGLKLYETRIELSEASKTGSAVYARCTITLGFRHQVRTHLAWLSLPVQNDALYNYRCRMAGECAQMQFFADTLIFRHPATGDLTKISANV